MSFSSTRTADADGMTKEEALRDAFVKLGVDADLLTGTAEQIRDAAIAALGVHPNSVTIRIVSEGTKGLLGLGSKPAAVRISIQEMDEVEPYDVLREMLDLMGIDAEIKTEERDGDLILNIDTDDVAILIGRHGRTLDSIQYLVNSIMNKSSLVKRRIVVNAGDYREKREDMLTEMAHHAARSVRATGREVSLDPMNPRDRRIVHMALREDEDVRTFSRGEGAFRAVVIVPGDKYVPDDDDE
ncbi:MAG: protein jag [Candidatus Poribacteria bacterium]|nr:protein jag [Candidatus Poribacteria bacterium]